MTVRVLLVEDDRVQLDLYTEALEMLGFETTGVMYGDIAMETLRQLTPDLLVLDMNLPRVNGEEIIRFVRSNEHLSNVKIIAMTVDPHWQEAEIAQQADLFLMKPLNIIELQQWAQRLLN